MHVHLIGVAGTGMGALAGLLRRAGHRVTGSDRAFHPPMGDALGRWGVETMPGWDPANLEPAPDLVIVGNVCRRDNPEARAAIDGGMRVTSMPAAIEEMFLTGQPEDTPGSSIEDEARGVGSEADGGAGVRSPHLQRPGWVVAGTHGKTTTSTLLAWLLFEAGADPSFLVGGIPRDFGESFRLGPPGAPFVLEGDEYDSAFFEKTPKFWRYRPHAAIVTSIEHDHIDIYPDAASYRAAFEQFVARIPEDGLLVAWAGDPLVREVASGARCTVRYYALDGDACGDVTPVWLAAKVAAQGEMQPFDLFVGGSSCGRVLSPLSGEHNIRNAVAAIALAAEGAGIPVSVLTAALTRFRGVKRRQELLGEVDGVRVYDDFAHHPTAVRETLRGLRERHPEGKLIAVFEPRSATASRRLHQAEYPDAFAPADLAILAPVGRPEIAEAERLDVRAIAAAVVARGRRAEAPPDIDAIVARIAGEAKPGDTVVLMSNGAFGGIHDRILLALTDRHLASRPATMP